MPRQPAESASTLDNGHERVLRLPVRHLMKERAYTEIKRGILRGEFPPGAFLAERQLAEQLGMSKTPVRAALERLALEGFIAISPQQGIIIRDLTVDEIADHYEIRTALETYVLRTLAGRLTPAQVEQLEANLRAQEDLSESDKESRAVDLDTAFHTLFCEFLGNQEILRVMAQLREKIHRVIRKVFQLRADRFHTSYAEHRAIADAVLRADAALAARLIEDHLEYGKQCLLSPRRTASKM
jgi:DNA-binding GntR family transcriptional regulator